MDAGATTSRSARLLYPYQLVRGQTQTISCPMWASNALVAPSSGTVDVLRPSGTKLVDGGTVVVSGSIGTFSLTGAVLAATESFGARWQVVWTLNFASGVAVEVVRASAIVQRYQLYNTVTDGDLFGRVKSLDPSGNAPIGDATTYQDKIDQAWGTVIRKIVSSGQRPDLITTPDALHDAVKVLTLALIFEDFGTRLNEAYREIARDYRAEYRETFETMSYGLDVDETGNQPEERTRSTPTLWLGGSPL